EQGVVRADADIDAGMELGAALANDDVAGDDCFRAELLDAEALAGRVAAVAGRAACFLMGHLGLLRMSVMRAEIRLRRRRSPGGARPWPCAPEPSTTCRPR